MKKTFVRQMMTLLVTVTMLLALVPSAFAASNATISMSSTSQTVRPGEEFTVSVNISENSNLGAFEGRVYYDDTQVVCTSISRGSALKAWSDRLEAEGKNLPSVMFNKDLKAEADFALAAAEGGMKESGSVFDFKFKVLDTAKKGSTGLSYKIKVCNDAEKNTQPISVTPALETTTPYDVQVTPVVATGITMKSAPTKLDYFTGNTLDLTGGAVTVSYSDGTTQDFNLTDSKCKVSGVDTSKAGTYSATVECEGKTLANAFTVNVKDKSITSVQLTAPSKVDYIEGQDLAVAGGLWTINYDDGSKATQTLTLNECQGFDKNKIGTQTVTATLTGTDKTGSFDVTVAAKQSTSIVVSTLPTKTEYKIVKDKALDVTGGKVTVKYNNDTESTVDLTEAMCTTPDLTTLGEKTITVSYEGKTTQFKVTVVDKVLDAIKVTTKPTQKSFVKGEEFNCIGGKVELSYDNDTKETIDMTNDMCTGYDPNTIGKQTITVSVEENGVTKTTQYEVEVIAKEVTKIEIVKAPTAALGGVATADGKFVQDQDLEILADGSINVTYNDGTTELKPITVDMIKADLSKVGQQDATVEYGGKTATYKIDVAEKQITKTEINPLPEKTLYKIGKDKDLVTTGGKFNTVWNNGKNEAVDFAPTDCAKDYDLTKLGDQTITVTKGDQKATYSIKVIDKELTGFTISTNPTTEFIEGTEFNVNGGVLTLSYDNDTADTIPMEKAMCSPVDMNKVGTQTVTVTYGGFTQTYDITIVEKQVVSIEMTTMPSKVDYIEGQKLDVTGGTFTATYDNGKKETINLDKATCVADMDKVGNGQDVTVTYGGKTTSFPINIVAKKLSTIELTPAPTKTNYVAGVDNTLDVNGGKLKVTYDNGKSVLVDLKAEWCSGYEPLKLGKQTINVSYTENNITKTTTFDIVVEKVVTSIEWNTMPVKVEYKQNEQFEADGTINAVYSDSSKDENITVTKEMCSGHNTAVAGPQTVTVTYENKTVNYTINISGITIATEPNKVEYTEGEKIDLTGMKLTFYKADGTPVELDWDPTTMTVNGYDANKVGAQNLSITYIDPETGAKYTLDNALTVTVKSNKVDPEKPDNGGNTNNGGNTTNGSTNNGQTVHKTNTTNPKTGMTQEMQAGTVVISLMVLSVCGIVAKRKKK